MNIAQIFNASAGASFKIIAAEDFNVIEFTLFRNVSSFLVAGVWLYLASYNPIKLFPSQDKLALFCRIMTGQFNFFLLNLAISMAPLTLVTVFYQTSPFWITIIAYYMLGEPIFKLEILSMIICFSAVVAIAIQTKNESESSKLSEEEKEETSQAFLGLVIVFITSIIRAMNSVLNRVLKHHATPVVIFYHTIGGFCMAGTYIMFEMAIKGESSRLVIYT